MREIKFKLFKDDKFVGYEVHEEYPEPNKEIRIEYYEFDHHGCESHYIPHDDKKQWIDVVDRDKTEVYEGDRFHSILDDTNYTVGFVDGCFCLINERDTFARDIIDLQEMWPIDNNNNIIVPPEPTNEKTI